VKPGQAHRHPRILEEPRSDAAAVLERRLIEIEAEIGALRDHQRAIARLLKDTDRLRSNEW